MGGKGRLNPNASVASAKVLCSTCSVVAKRDRPQLDLAPDRNPLVRLALAELGLLAAIHRYHLDFDGQFAIAGGSVRLDQDVDAGVAVLQFVRLLDDEFVAMAEAVVHVQQL